MDKLKKNSGVKVAAVIVFAVSLLAFVISGFLGLLMYDQDAFSSGGSERIKNSVIENISYQYVNDALQYYEADINGESTSYYHDEFSSKNTNFSFSIVPTRTDDQKTYGTLSNYGCSDYQYTSTSIHTVNINEPVSESFKFYITKEEIAENAKAGLISFVDNYSDYYNVDSALNGEYGVLNTSPDYQNYNDDEGYDEEDYDEDYVTEARADELTTEDLEISEYSEDSAEKKASEDEYGTEFYGVYNSDSDGNHYILYNGLVYALEDNEEFVSTYKKFTNNLPKRTRYTYRAYYDTEQQCYNVVAEGQSYIDVELTYKVRTNIRKAHDRYYLSMYLKYTDLAVKVAVPTIIISFILVVVLGGFLIASAGHRKNCETVSLNAFDKIPYDILLLFMAGVALAVALLVDEYSYNMTESALMIVTGAACWAACICLTLLIMSTVTRMKCMEWAFLKNTITYRLLRLIGKLFKKIWGGILYLWSNVGSYWKYLGTFLLAGLFELFVSASENARMSCFVIVLEKLVLGAVLAYAISNLVKLRKAVKQISKGHTDYKVETEHMLFSFREAGENLNQIGEGIQLAVEDQMKSERMKTELITNVSHDIKTPLTSIISYVDLLEKEELDNPNANEYLEVLERQSAKLKKLIQDLIDVSKASTGNMNIELTETDVKVLLEQAMGEFTEALEKKGLKVNISYNTDNTVALADGRQLWRVFENLINNICKYALENSRVYIDVGMEGQDYISVIFKNISADALNITGDELMERFVRGDSSRNTEGSGLGLSIARNLVELMNGKMNIIVDGDLFKVILLLELN